MRLSALYRSAPFERGHTFVEFTVARFETFDTRLYSPEPPLDALEAGARFFAKLGYVGRYRVNVDRYGIDAVRYSVYTRGYAADLSGENIEKGEDFRLRVVA